MMALYSSHVTLFLHLKLTLTYNCTFIDETKEKREEPYDPLFLPLTKLGAMTRDRRFLCIVGEVLSLGWLKYKTFEVSLQVWQPLFSFLLLFYCVDWSDITSNGQMWLFFTQDVNAIVALLLPSFACRCIDNNDLLSLQEILVTVWTIMHIRCRVHLSIFLHFHVAGYIIPNPCFKYFFFSSDGYKCWRLWWQHCHA